MPDLGQKHQCFACEARFYDLGRPEAICPKCGANQKDAKKPEPAAEARPVRRRRREEVVRVEEEGAATGSAKPSDDGEVDASTDLEVDIAGDDDDEVDDSDEDDADED